jgi:hypothetical protein
MVTEASGRAATQAKFAGCCFGNDMRPLRVLVACEFSGVVREAFRRRGGARRGNGRAVGRSRAMSENDMRGRSDLIRH